MIRIGIMQGRLTPSFGRGIQFLPFESWKEEFYIAKKIKLSEIEWIFDCERYKENPIWTQAGRDELKKIIDETNVNVNSVCFDYFMRCPFYKKQGSERRELYKINTEISYKVIDGLADIGGKLLEIPMVDASSLKNEEEKKSAIEYVKSVAEYAAERNIKIGLETDLAPGKFIDFLERIEPFYIYANYDSGNSSGIGYDPNEEIPSLGNRICNMHIKDRVYNGTTVALSTGSADFEAVFKNLKKVGYKNSIILQAARGEDGSEIENIKRQIEFVKRYVQKYAL